MPNTRNRITVVEQIYHQVSGQNPTAISSGFSREVKSPEQVYSRTPPNGIGDWEKLNLGWVENPSMVVIRNNDKVNTLEIGFTSKTGEISDIRFFVPPGEPFRFMVNLYDRLLIRSSFERAAYTIYALPE